MDDTGTLFDLFNRPGPGARKVQVQEQSDNGERAEPERLVSLTKTRDEARRILIEQVKRKVQELYSRIGAEREIDDRDAEALLLASDGKYIQLIESLSQLVDRLQKLEQALQNIPENAKHELTTLLTTLAIEDFRRRKAGDDGGIAREIANVVKEVAKTKILTREVLKLLDELEKIEHEEELRVRGNGKMSESELSRLVEAIRSELAQTRRALMQMLSHRDELQFYDVEKLRETMEKLKSFVKNVAPLVGLKVSEGEELTELAKTSPEIAALILSEKTRASILQQNMYYALFQLFLKKLDKITDMVIEHGFEFLKRLFMGEEETPELGEEEDSSRACVSSDEVFKRKVAEYLQRMRNAEKFGQS